MSCYQYRRCFLRAAILLCILAGGGSRLAAREDAPVQRKADLLRIHIVLPGTYHITGQQMRRFRPDLEQLDPGRLVLKYNQRPYPALARGLDDKGRLTDASEVIFYAPAQPPVPVVNVFGDNAPQLNFLQLFFEGDPSEALRFTPASPSTPSTAPTWTVMETRRLEPDLIWEFFQPTGDAEKIVPTDFRFWAKLARPATSENEPKYAFKIPCPDLDTAASVSAQVKVYLYGISNFHTVQDHNVRILINKHEAARGSWGGLAPATLVGEIPSSALTRSDNLVEVELFEPQTANAPKPVFDVAMLDWMELTYPRRLRAQKNYVAFSSAAAAPSVVRAGGFTTSALTGLDVNRARLLDVETRRNPDSPGNWIATVPLDGATSAAAIFGADTPLGTPYFLEGVSWLGLREMKIAADYLVISPQPFIPPLEPLIAQRRAEGLRVAVIPAEAIYEEFGGGFPGAQPIKDFVTFAYKNWQRPRYLLLVGDACAVSAIKTWLPAYSFNTLGGSHASDQWFAMIEGGGVNGTLPDMAVGRISATATTQVALVVAKILKREQELNPGPWRAESLLIVASESWAERSARLIAQSKLFPWMAAKTLNTNKQATRVEEHQQLTRDIAAALNQGQFFTVFLGHGGGAVWEVGPSIRQDFFRVHLFDKSNVDALTNADRQTLVLAMTCFTNDFDHPHFLETIGESFLRSPGGAFAVLGTSGRVDSVVSSRFAREFIGRVVEERPDRLGQAMLATLKQVNNEDLNRHLILLGDPASRLRFPERILPLSGAAPGGAASPASSDSLTLERKEGAVMLRGKLENSNYSGEGQMRISDESGRILETRAIPIKDGLIGVEVKLPGNGGPEAQGPWGISVYAADPKAHRDWLGAASIRK
ncbi:MAG: C25 family cysteine peptidase [Candidatus Sumerlaeota bacterium]|nr:C25 family cysteine peptidase [Candidatus Sumerlaeota bacterium]